MILKFFAGLLLLLGLSAAAVFFLLENPDRFKDQIAQAIRSTSGYEVAIGGELSWRYWPPIAIRVEQIALGAPGQAPFVKLDEVTVDIDLIPLIAQQRIVDINDISISGGDITLQVDQNGVGNWELETSATKSPADKANPSDIAPTSTLQKFLARKLSIRYVDIQQKLDYDINLDRLSTSALTADRPFDISLVAAIKDKVESLEVSIESTGQLQYQASNDQLGFDDLVTSMNLVIDGQKFPQISMVSKGQWRPSQQAIVLSRNDVRTSSANINSTGVISLVGPAPRFDGVVNVQTADPELLGRDFDVELPVSFLQFTADMAADSTLVHMRTIEGEFDQSKFNGSATYELAPVNALTADIRIDKLDAATYLSDATGPTGPNNAKPASQSDVASDSELIPVATLRETRLKTIIRIDSLKLDDSLLDNVKVELDNNGKVVDLIANASGYQGKIVASAKTTLVPNVSTALKVNLDRLDIPKLIEIEGVTGALTANANLTFSGANQSDLAKTLVGKTTFIIKDGTLDVRPLKSVAGTIDAIRGKPSSVSEWPDIMPFDAMTGDHVFTGGLNTGQVFNATLENISLMALGGVDLVAGTLDYDVTVMLKKNEQGKFKVSDQLSGIRWPLSCSGKFTDSPAELCLGKDGAISDLVADLLKQELKRRGSNKIEELVKDKIPEEYKDLLKNLFK